MRTFASVDFETADYSAESACAVGLTVVSDADIVYKGSWLIRPPSKSFAFTHIHGLTWQAVKDAPTFEELWAELKTYFRYVDFLAAHNASFDRRVLRACCEFYGIAPPSKSFICTVQLARSQWGIFPTTLPQVCQHLHIPLRHHDAGSDAEACARIVIAAQCNGWRLSRPRRRT